MSNLVDLWSETNASLIGDDATPALTLGNSSGPALRLTRTGTAGNASIAMFELAPASVASTPVFGLKNTSFVSAVSIIFAAGTGWAGMGGIRVARTDGTFGWIPVLPDAQFTAGVVA